jgi:hypothetical protein
MRAIRWFLLAERFVGLLVTKKPESQLTIRLAPVPELQSAAKAPTNPAVAFNEYKLHRPSSELRKTAGLPGVKETLKLSSRIFNPSPLAFR